MSHWRCIKVLFGFRSRAISHQALKSLYVLWLCFYEGWPFRNDWPRNEWTSVFLLSYSHVSVAHRTRKTRRKNNPADATCLAFEAGKGCPVIRVKFWTWWKFLNPSHGVRHISAIKYDNLQYFTHSRAFRIFFMHFSTAETLLSDRFECSNVLLNEHSIIWTDCVIQ